MAHIVLYEENDLMRSLLNEWLSEAGYRVSAVGPGEAWPGTETDLVIVSIYMPKNVGAKNLMPGLFGVKQCTRSCRGLVGARCRLRLPHPGVTWSR